MRTIALWGASALALALVIACGGDDEKKPPGTGGAGGSDASSVGGSGGSSGGGSSVTNSTGGSTSNGGTSGSGGSGGASATSTSSGGSAGEAGANASAGGAAGESSGGGGEAGADPSTTGNNPVCESATSFSCADFEARIEYPEYDAAVPEVVITLGEGFPKIKSISSRGDYSTNSTEGACDYSVQLDIEPAGRTLHIPWPDSGTELYLRNFVLVDECDRTLTLDPGASCLEPRLYLTTGASFECADDPHDDDCSWSCE